MSRFYSIPFSAVAVSAQQDLFEITAVGKPFTLHEITIFQTSDFGDAAAEGLQVLIKRGVGITSGSGGSSVTPAKHNTVDTSAVATAEVNNTTPASGGAITTIRAEGFNVQGGYQYLPMREQRPFFRDGEVCLISLQAPADSLTVSGTVVIEED